MWRRVARFPEGLLFLRVFFGAALVPVLLRLPLPWVATVLGQVPVSPRRNPAAISRVRGYVQVAIRMGRPLVRNGCLTRGITSYFFLRRAGLDVSLAFGMGRPDGQFAGHCWLLKDGEPFLERQDPRPVFAEILRIPGPSIPVSRRGAGGSPVPQCPNGADL